MTQNTNTALAEIEKLDADAFLAVMEDEAGEEIFLVGRESEMAYQFLSSEGFSLTPAGKHPIFHTLFYRMVE